MEKKRIKYIENKTDIELYKPKAFISCSIRDNDKEYVELVESILRDQGIEPMGTVGRYTNYAEPIAKSMVKEMKKADVFVIAATTRYFQKTKKYQRKSQHSMSEMLHVESGMAYMNRKPMVVFVQPETHVGSFLPGITQYFEISSYEEYEQIKTKVSTLFNDIKNQIIVKIEKAEKRAITELIKNIFVVIGIVAFVRGIIKVFR